jgi:hypothetical protein
MKRAQNILFLRKIRSLMLKRLEKHRSQWKGLQGLAVDVRFYGQWIRDETQKRIGHLIRYRNYPGDGQRLARI